MTALPVSIYPLALQEFAYVERGQLRTIIVELVVVERGELLSDLCEVCKVLAFPARMRVYLNCSIDHPQLEKFCWRSKM